MEGQQRDLEAAPAGLEVHAGWRYNEYLFPASWQLKHAAGPTSILSPTLTIHEVPHHGVRTITTARRTRKGRHPIIEAVSEERKIEHVRPRTLLHPFGYKLWGWAPRNISYWVGMAFTVGSIAWVVNGTFAMWPLKNERASLYVTGYTAVLGGFLFEVGSILAFLEMVNSNCKNIDVGHRLEHDPEARTTRVYHSKNDASYHRLDEVAQPLHDKVQNGTHLGDAANGAGVHNGHGFENGVASNGAGKRGEALVVSRAEQHAERKQRRRKWLWCAWQPRSLSYWTVVSQLIGATIFGVPACITGVPHVLWFNYPPSHWQGWLILYWLPQMIGSIFFIINSYLTMVESSHSWFGIKFWDLGWQAGFWNLLGAIGFLLSGLFGALVYPTECCQKWGTYFSTWWGSIFFLISSYLLIPEALNK